MDIKKILKLMEKKYPTNYKKGINPALFIYNDESGRILKDAMNPAYGGELAQENLLFDFHNVDELVAHLQEGEGETS